MSCDSFFTTITWLGSLYFLIPASVILALCLYMTGRPCEIILLGLSLSLTVLVAHAAKGIFRRPRPEALDLLVPMPSGWSFPSSHTAQATAFFLTVTIIAFRSLPPVWAGICTGVSTLFIIGVGWSRVYLQVHYLSDVVAGCALAILLVTAVNILLPFLQTLFGDF